MNAVNVVVSCSSRKRYTPPKELTARDLPTGDVQLRIGEWCNRLNAVQAPSHPATDIYIGDQWSIARGLAAFARPFGLNVRIWICSAGYGLIAPTKLIKPYAATFSPTADDCVFASGAREEAKTWWNGVSHSNTADPTRGPISIRALCEQNNQTPLLIALSRDYLDAVSNDILEAVKISYFKEHLAIVSCGTLMERSPLKNNLIPCNSSMAASVGGSLTSLNIRIVRHLLATCKSSTLSINNLRSAVSSIPSTPRTLRAINHTTDEEVLHFIRQYLAEDKSFSASALLRRYRNAGFSCAQKRFTELFTRQIQMEAA